MKVIELKLGKNRRDICAAELESLFAENITQKEIARRLKMDKSYLSAKINQSVELMQARSRGIRSAGKGENMTQINQPLEEYLKSEHAKKQWEIGEIDSELCNICNEPMPQNTLTVLFGTHYKCFQNESVQRKQETLNG